MEEVKDELDFTGLKTSIHNLSVNLREEHELWGKPSEGALSLAMQETIISEKNVNKELESLVYKNGDCQKAEIDFGNMVKVHKFLKDRKAHWNMQFQYMRLQFGDSYIGEEIYEINAIEYAIKHIKSLDKERRK